MKIATHCTAHLKTNYNYITITSQLHCNHIMSETLCSTTILELRNEQKTQKVCTFLMEKSDILASIYRDHTKRHKHGHEFTELSNKDYNQTTQYLFLLSNEILERHGFLTGATCVCEIHRTTVDGSVERNQFAIHEDDYNRICNTVIYYVDVDNGISGGELVIYDNNIAGDDDDKFCATISPKSELPEFIKVVVMTGDVLHRVRETSGFGNRGCIVVQVVLDIERSDNHMKIQ